MSVHHKKPRSAGLSVLVYDRGLHPELFTVDTRRVRTLGGLDLSMCLLAGGGWRVISYSGRAERTAQALKAEVISTGAEGEGSLGIRFLLFRVKRTTVLSLQRTSDTL